MGVDNFTEAGVFRLVKIFRNGSIITWVPKNRRGEAGAMCYVSC